VPAQHLASARVRVPRPGISTPEGPYPPARPKRPGENRTFAELLPSPPSAFRGARPVAAWRENGTRRRIGRKYRADPSRHQRGWQPPRAGAGPGSWTLLGWTVESSPSPGRGATRAGGGRNITPGFRNSADRRCRSARRPHPAQTHRGDARAPSAITAPPPITRDPHASTTLRHQARRCRAGSAILSVRNMPRMGRPGFRALGPMMDVRRRFSSSQIASSDCRSRKEITMQAGPPLTPLEPGPCPGRAEMESLTTFRASTLRQGSHTPTIAHRMARGVWAGQHLIGGRRISTPPAPL